MSNPTREDYEAAIGAITTRFNDIEIALIDLIEQLVGDGPKGEAIGWALGFQDKLKVVGALARIDDLQPDWLNRLASALKEAERLSNEVRNQVAHAELWQDPINDSINFRKGRTDKIKGFIPSHPDWTVETLRGFVREIEEVAERLRDVASYCDMRSTERSSTS